jgi:hypothetical protein
MWRTDRAAAGRDPNDPLLRPAAERPLSNTYLHNTAVLNRAAGAVRRRPEPDLFDREPQARFEISTAVGREYVQLT